ncbi:MAG: hypothetical protein LC772_11325, partial [Chloroflexi bacterium]|nr:hypothetical protein [Chloroflexota bacterium]
MSVVEEMEVEHGDGSTADETPTVRILAAALHVLDHRGGGLQLSDSLLDLSPAAHDFLSNSIVRSIQAPRARMARFEGNSTLSESSS